MSGRKIRDQTLVFIRSGKKAIGTGKTLTLLNRRTQGDVDDALNGERRRRVQEEMETEEDVESTRMIEKKMVSVSRVRGVKTTP